MFSAKYASLDKQIREILENVEAPSEERVKGILEESKTERLRLSGVAELLEAGDDKTFGINGYNKTINNFVWDKHICKIEHLYEGLRRAKNY